MLIFSSRHVLQASYQPAFFYTHAYLEKICVVKIFVHHQDVIVVASWKYIHDLKSYYSSITFTDMSFINRIRFYRAKRKIKAIIQLLISCIVADS